MTKDNKKNKEIKVIKVSEVALYFGIWKDSQKELRGKKIVVLNSKNHRIVGAFKLIDIPLPIEDTCPCCKGTGKIKIDYNRKGVKSE